MNKREEGETHRKLNREVDGFAREQIPWPRIAIWSIVDHVSRGSNLTILNALYCT